MRTASNIHSPLADRGRALAPAGIGAIPLWAQKRGRGRAIDQDLPLLKRSRPDHESDQVRKCASHLLAGGRRREHLEVRRHDEVDRDARGAERLPDPTPAGDFCRRFRDGDVARLRDSFHEARRRAWGKPPADFVDDAFLDAAGTLRPEHDRGAGKPRGEKRSLRRREFRTFGVALIPVPCQVVRTRRRLIDRLWSWNPWPGVFLRLVEGWHRVRLC